MVKNGQKMEQTFEFEAVKTLTSDDTPLYTEGYEFLLNEQPNLFTVNARNPLTPFTGACVFGTLPMLVDLKSGIESDGMAGLFLVGSLCFGYFLTETITEIKRERNTKLAEIKNVELLRTWTRPIYVLPYDRFDFTVEQRCVEITRLLNDGKCANGLHLSLIEAEKKFSYSIEYGFRSGTTCQTEIGLPIISLFPSLFLLRGANDKRSWVAFQHEAVRIANDIDNAFATFWHKEDPTKFKLVAGGQLMI